MKKQSQLLLIALGMIFIAAASRFLPHWHNFTAVGAMGLFGAAYLPKKYAVVVPLAALWISDLILNNVVYAAFYDGFVWFSMRSAFVYLGFLAIVGVGLLLFRRVNAKNVLAGSILGSIAFFLISNFGSFAVDPLYPKTPGGLGAAYLAGLPFFWNTLLANVFFTAVFFGSFEWIKRSYFQTQSVRL